MCFVYLVDLHSSAQYDRISPNRVFATLERVSAWIHRCPDTVDIVLAHISNVGGNPWRLRPT